MRRSQGKKGAGKPPPFALPPVMTHAPTPVPLGRPIEPVVPKRRLRVYALDPSIAKNLASLAINETILSVPWDDVPETEDALRPGPIGEYLEVVDVDPASDKVHEPVDLNDRLILAQDGWAPSEGNPRFHQQMVYAVAMTTIGHFERALARKALWAPRRVEDEGPDGEIMTRFEEVRRLRIYPHAFRSENAYYSPDKKALLLGYFPSDSRDEDATAPGSMVFACLSSDVVAHEMSHALLDGLHRRFQEASNPDVPAFHEGFADIVALFQHFTVIELVRFEIGRVRGDLSASNLLGGLAQQFGQGTSRGGPLRDYNDPKMQTMSYADTVEPHERGSILVFAVFEAFKSIVAHRTSDLLRLASNGTGVLPQGALHPDLVERLTLETCKTARHVLEMCIRALDYAPAADITFGDYLRALVTADLDVVPQDTMGYRTAIMEAFRRRGILPRDIRTISEESLSWNTPAFDRPSWLPELIGGIDLRWNRDVDRSEIFRLNEKNRWIVWGGLKKVFTQDPSTLGEFGLLAGVPRYNPDGTIKREAKPGETTFEVSSVRPVRRVTADGEFRTDIVAVIGQRQAVPINPSDREAGFFWFRGGATLVIDARESRERIRYAIVKSSGSRERMQRQAETAVGALGSTLQRLYFGSGSEQVSEPFALLHSDRGMDHE